MNELENSRKVLAELLVDSLPESWQANLLPKVEGILAATPGDAGVEAAEKFLQERCDLYSQVPGQPQIEYFPRTG